MSHFYNYEPKKILKLIRKSENEPGYKINIYMYEVWQNDELIKYKLSWNDKVQYFKTIEKAHEKYCNLMDNNRIDKYEKK